MLSILAMFRAVLALFSKCILETALHETPATASIFTSLIDGLVWDGSLLELNEKVLVMTSALETASSTSAVDS
jgi:hypothetical protein